MSFAPLAALRDAAKTARLLQAYQLSGQASREKALLFARAGAALESSGVEPGAPVVACFVPGRIEVLGKHTDYAGGRSLVAAAEHGFCLVASARSDSELLMVDAASDQRSHFALNADLQPRQRHWSNYPMTVARRVARNFPGPLRGACIAFISDLPPAAGMSSSSALIVSTFLALSTINKLPTRDAYVQSIRSDEDLAGYLGTVENGQSYGELAGDRGVGTFGGSEDHTAILCARHGQLVQYSYCPVRFERPVRLTDDYLFAVAVSGVVAEKTGGAMEKYNRISQRAGAVIELWRAATGRTDAHLGAALASAPDAAKRIREVIQQNDHHRFDRSELLDRFEQFLAESEQIVPRVDDRLAGSSLAKFGELVERSQALGSQWLGNQIPETVFLAEGAKLLGAVAASAFGAGFGGSVWALVPADQAAEFGRQWIARYAKRFPQHTHCAAFLVTRPGPSAFYLYG